MQHLITTRDYPQRLKLKVLVQLFTLAQTMMLFSITEDLRGEMMVPPAKKLEDLIHLAELCVDLLQQNEEHYAEVSTKNISLAISFNCGFLFYDFLPLTNFNFISLFSFTNNNQTIRTHLKKYLHDLSFNQLCL